MLQKFELTMTTDYANDWSLQDALREFIQNAIDQSVVVPDNEMSIEYDGNNKLSICNKSSILKKSSLLLGATTKKDDNSTIGQFGEGYKIALLVLTRLNKKVTIYNYGNKEIWTAAFFKSRRFEGEKILRVNVETLKIWDKAPNNNLTIEIEGIKAEDYQELIQRTLILQKSYKKNMLESERGIILLDDKFKGKIYVNGLYINTNSTLSHGYDIKPQYLNIGRDRNLVDSFDIYNATSLMWKEQDNFRLKELIKSDAPDVKYLIDDWYLAHKEVDLGEELLEELQEEYGENAIPVSTQADWDYISANYVDAKPIMANKISTSLMVKSETYANILDSLEKIELTKKQKYEMWKDKYNWKYLGPAAIEELDDIILNLL